MGEDTASRAGPARTATGNAPPRLRRLVPGRRNLPVLLLGGAVLTGLALAAAAAGGAPDSVRINPTFPAGDATALPPGAPGARIPTATSSPRSQPRPAPPANQSPRGPGVPGSASCPTPPRSVVSVAPGRGKTVALTFDDGPSAYTPGVLDALARAHVHATFFVVGQRVPGRAATLARVVRAGHLVGDHSWDHGYPSSVPGGWSRAYLARSMAPTDAAVARATGHRPCWFRPPGGFLPLTTLPVARAQRMGVVLWSVDTRDWAVETVAQPTSAQRRAMTAAIVRAALAGLGQRHPLVLLHDGGGYRGATVEALPTIIAAYRAAGYAFVRLDGEH